MMQSRTKARFYPAKELETRKGPEAAVLPAGYTRGLMQPGRG